MVEILIISDYLAVVKRKITMAYTKLNIINAAFAEIGISGSNFELTAEQYDEALFRLNMLVAEVCDLMGVDIPYSQSGNLTEEMALPIYAVSALYKNLAISLASSYGRDVNITTMASAKRAIDLMLLKSSIPKSRPMPRYLPRGAGAKNYSNPFFNLERQDECCTVLADETYFEV